MNIFNYLVIAYLGSAFYMGYVGAQDMWNLGTEQALMAGGVSLFASLPMLGLIYAGFLIVNWIIK